VAETLHPYLFDEHRVQYSGIVDESAQVRLGRLLVPSIILLASTGRTKAGTDAGRHIAVQIWDVREGRILATAHGMSRSEAIGHAMHQALTELDLLMAKAPRMGCPH
jgi:hypothetical protein